MELLKFQKSIDFNLQHYSDFYKNQPIKKSETEIQTFKRLV